MWQHIYIHYYSLQREPEMVELGPRAGMNNQTKSGVISFHESAMVESQSKDKEVVGLEIDSLHSKYTKQVGLHTIVSNKRHA